MRRGFFCYVDTRKGESKIQELNKLWIIFFGKIELTDRTADFLCGGFQPTLILWQTKRRAAQNQRKRKRRRSRHLPPRMIAATAKGTPRGIVSAIPIARILTGSTGVSNRDRYRKLLTSHRLARWLFFWGGVTEPERLRNFVPQMNAN